MKKAISFILSLICAFSLVSCQKENTSIDFENYENDCISIVQFVLDYSGELSDHASYTLDLDQETIIIDDTYQSNDFLTPSIKNIFEKGFTYIEVNKDCMIFWEDDGFYGWLWSDDPTKALERITESDRPYMKSQKITDKWYEVRTNDSF